MLALALVVVACHALSALAGVVAVVAPWQLGRGREQQAGRGREAAGELVGAPSDACVGCYTLDVGRV